MASTIGSILPSAEADGGISFPEVRCFKQGTCDNTGAACTGRPLDCIDFGGGGFPTFGTCEGIFYDGTSLAAHGDDVYFASTNFATLRFDVWVARDGTLEFFPLPDLHPLDDNLAIVHPRLRVVDSTLYMVGTVLIGDVAWPMASTLDLSLPDATWTTPLRVGAPMAASPAVDLTGGKALRTANQFSFDVVSVSSGAPEFRIMYTRFSTKLDLEVVTCQVPLEENPDQPGFGKCIQRGWGGPNHNPGADEFSPQLRVSGIPPRWRAIWLVRPLGTGQVAVHRGNLAVVAGVDVLATFDLVPLQTPCAYPSPGGHYWGDYNDSSPSDQRRLLWCLVRRRIS